MDRVKILLEEPLGQDDVTQEFWGPLGPTIGIGTDPYFGVQMGYDPSGGSPWC